MPGILAVGVKLWLRILPLVCAPRVTADHFSLHASDAGHIVIDPAPAVPETVYSTHEEEKLLEWSDGI